MVNITSLEDTPSSLEETLDQEAAPLVQKIDIESPLEQRAVDQQSTILEVPPAELSEARLSGDFSAEDLLRQYPNSEAYLNTLFTGQVPVEEAAKMVAAYEERQSKTVGVREVFFNSILMTDDGEIDPGGLSMLNNYEWLNKRIEERLEANDPSTFRWIAAGFDNFSQLPLLIVRDLIKFDQRKSVEFAESLNLDPEAFKAYWEKELASAESEGIFNIREFENLREVQLQLDNLGTDPDANFKQFMALAEIATAGSTRLAVRGGIKAASLITKELDV